MGWRVWRRRRRREAPRPPAHPAPLPLPDFPLEGQDRREAIAGLRYPPIPDDLAHLSTALPADRCPNCDSPDRAVRGTRFLDGQRENVVRHAGWERVDLAPTTLWRCDAPWHYERTTP